MSIKDRDGYTAMDLAKQNGHKNCHRQLIRFEWLNRSKKGGPRSDHPLFAHQYFDSSLKTYLQGSLAQMYCQQILPPGEFEGTGLGAPRRKANSPTSRKSLASSCTEQKTDGDHERQLGKIIFYICTYRFLECCNAYRPNLGLGVLDMIGI